jgi:hypothetical protein
VGGIGAVDAAVCPRVGGSVLHVQIRPRRWSNAL